MASNATTHAVQHDDALQPAGEDIVRNNLPFRLWDLPQELQDIVFELAYPDEVNLQIIFKSEFKADQAYQRKKVGKSFVPATFPSPKVNEWLVSKRYFLAAASAWIGAQTFSSTNPPGPFSRKQDAAAAFEFENCGIYRDFCRRTDIHWDRWDVVGPSLYPSLYPSLKYLTVRVDWDDFPTHDNQYAWEIEYTLHNLDTLLDKSGLSGLIGPDGLPNIEIASPRSTFAITDGQKRILQANAAKLGDRLRQHASKLRSSGMPVIQKPQKYMYRGSMVLRLQQSYGKGGKGVAATNTARDSRDRKFYYDDLSFNARRDGVPTEAEKKQEVIRQMQMKARLAGTDPATMKALIDSLFDDYYVYPRGIYRNREGGLMFWGRHSTAENYSILSMMFSLRAFMLMVVVSVVCLKLWSK